MHLSPSLPLTAVNIDGEKEKRTGAPNPIAAPEGVDVGDTGRLEGCHDMPCRVMSCQVMLRTRRDRAAGGSGWKSRLEVPTERCALMRLGCVFTMKRVVTFLLLMLMLMLLMLMVPLYTAAVPARRSHSLIVLS